MNDQQENRLSRAEKVSAFLQRYNKELNATLAITATLQPRLFTFIQNKLDHDEHAVQDNTGYADTKEDLEVKLENLADHIGSGLESYADDIDDFVLMNAVEFTLPQIQGFCNNCLLQYAKFVYGKAMDATIQPVLISSNNISMENITQLGSLITAYDNASPLPQQMKGESVAWGKQVDHDPAEIDKVLTRIRLKINTYRTNNVLRFDAFTAVDNVDDTGSHKKDEQIIAGGITATIGTFAYHALSAFTFTNTGSASATIAMYKGGVKQGGDATVNSCETLSAILESSATDGDELWVGNPATVTGSYTFSL